MLSPQFLWLPLSGISGSAPVYGGVGMTPVTWEQLSGARWQRLTPRNFG